MIGQQIRGLVDQFRLFGGAGFARMLHYTVLSTWSKLGRPDPTGPFKGVGEFNGCEHRARGADFHFQRATLEVRFLAEDIAQLTWRPGADPAPYAIHRHEWPEPETVTTAEDLGGWSVSTNALRIVVGRGGSLSFWNADNVCFRSEELPQRRGEWWRHKVALQPDTTVCGLGEHTGKLNLRGTHRRLWNSDPMTAYGPERDPLYLGIPVMHVLSSASGHLVFYENSHTGTVDCGDQLQVGFEGGALRYYVIPGYPERTIDRYTELTGRPPLPPHWALGYHQSRFSYRDEDEVRSIAQTFASKGLPLSAIHLDIHYMDGFRVFTVDGTRFPDLRRLAAELTKDGVKLVAILDPGVKRDEEYDVYREGLEQGMFCMSTNGSAAAAPVWPGWSVFPDFTAPKVRAWWGGLYQRLTDQGVCGFWNDMNEPAITALWGEHTLAVDVLHEFEGRKGDHREGHNVYGLMMVRAGYEGLRQLRPDIRPFLLTRSGWAGVQRYAWTWTGDISSGWDMLQQTVSTVLGLGLSGVPYSGPDIGGFKGALSRELYLRWFELASFLPFFRTHSSFVMAPREPWQFGEEALSLARNLLKTRVELMPYLYTLAWQATRTGHPLIRPLWWLDPQNRELRDREDAFLLGNALLIAPVFERARNGRTVELPPGTWYELWSGERRSYSVDVEAPPGRPPVFVRSGTLLPRHEGDGCLALHVYAQDAGTGAGAIYSDAGDGFGPWRVDRITGVRSASGLMLSWQTEGDYPFPWERVRLVTHGIPRDALQIDDTVRRVVPAIELA